MNPQVLFDSEALLLIYSDPLSLLFPRKEPTQAREYTF